VLESLGTRREIAGGGSCGAEVKNGFVKRKMRLSKIHTVHAILSAIFTPRWWPARDLSPLQGLAALGVLSADQKLGCTTKRASNIRGGQICSEILDCSYGNGRKRGGTLKFLFAHIFF
jgi:hypothetical protein